MVGAWLTVDPPKSNQSFVPASKHAYILFFCMHAGPAQRTSAPRPAGSGGLQCQMRLLRLHSCKHMADAGGPGVTWRRPAHPPS